MRRRVALRAVTRRSASAMSPIDSPGNARRTTLEEAQSEVIRANALVDSP